MDDKHKTMKHTDTSNFLHRVLNIDMVDFLSTLGYRPMEEKNGILTFPSPSRGSALMKVDTRLNTFNDHNLGIHNGNILQFGQNYYHCRLPKLLNILLEGYTFKNEETRHPDQIAIQQSNYKDDIHIIGIDPKQAKENQRMLLNRLNIPMEIGEQYTMGIAFLYRGVEKKGIGISNLSKGIEIYDGYNSYTIGKANFSLIDKRAKAINVFEHFEDMLALASMQGALPVNPNSILVLNSIYAFEQARNIMEGYPQVNLYLRHGTTSREYVGYSQWLDKQLYKDFSLFYKKQANLSNLHQNQGAAKRHQRQLKA